MSKRVLSRYTVYVNNYIDTLLGKMGLSSNSRKSSKLVIRSSGIREDLSEERAIFYDGKLLFKTKSYITKSAEGDTQDVEFRVEVEEYDDGRLRERGESYPEKSYTEG